MSSPPSDDEFVDVSATGKSLLRSIGVPAHVGPVPPLTGCLVCDKREALEDVPWYMRSDLCDEHKKEHLSLAADRILRPAIPPRHQHARDPIDKVKKIDPGISLYLYGDVGRGKTYQAAAWLKRAWMNHTKVIGTPPTVEWWYVPDLLDLLRARKLEVTQIGKGHYLVLDDLGAERQTDFAAEVVLKLMQRRYDEARGGMCITSNLDLGELAAALTPHDAPDSPNGKRIASRIAEMCKQVEVTGPDRRLTINKETP